MKNKLLPLFISLCLSPFVLAQEAEVDNCEDIDLSCRNGNTYQLHMTFDDGPARQTGHVLDILDSEGVKGTFFTMGSKLVNTDGTKIKSKNYIKILERMKNSGHNVGSHTYFHIRHRNEAWIENGLSTNHRAKEDANSLDRNNMTWRENINVPKNSKILQSYMNKDNKMYFRLPYGEGWYRSKKGEEADGIVLSELLAPTENGIHPRHVGWDIDTEDWRNPPRDKFFESLRQQICSRHGGVILMHDHTRATKNYLKCVLVGAKKAGHTFVDSPEAFIGRRGRNKVVMKYEDIPGIGKAPEQCCNNKENNDGPINQLSDAINDIEDKVTEDINNTMPNPTQKPEPEPTTEEIDDFIDVMF